jgi:hypothetical protein
MTRVCLLGTEEANLQYELLSRETAREALAAYDLREPFANSLAVETVSLGAAVALLNDLDWYLTRFVDDALVMEPSISESEWLSRELAAAIRSDAVDPEATGRFLRVYGVLRDDEGGDETTGDEAAAGAGVAAEANDAGPEETADDPAASASDDSAGPPPRLVEPMLVARTDEDVPTYDLRDVDETLVVRLTESEFGA